MKLKMPSFAMLQVVLYFILPSCTTHHLPYDSSQLELIAVDTISSNQIHLQGLVKDIDGTPVIFGSVAVYEEGVLVSGTETDFDGYYSISVDGKKSIMIEISYVGYKNHRYILTDFAGGKVYKADLNFLSVDDSYSNIGCGFRYIVPLIDMSNTTQGAIYSGDRLRKMPAY
jgi:hypothetical protein